MTREEAILVSAYTGFLLVPDFSDVHKFCEDTIGRPIFTHEFADENVQKEIQEKLRPQIMELIQNIAALRPVSREQVERVWPGCKMCKTPSIAPPVGFYCPWCGTPRSQMALEELRKRLEALNNDKK